VSAGDTGDPGEPGTARKATLPGSHRSDEAERIVGRAAELLLSAEILPGPSPLPDFERLLGRDQRRRSLGLLLGGMTTAAALMLLTILSIQDRGAVSYVVDGPIAISGDVIEAIGTVADGGSRLRFSEGTHIDLSRGARLRVLSRNASGASLALERGHADLTVTRRRGARWSVATGPFTVDVVGTRFSLDWSPDHQRMVVELSAGKVSVRGASVGGPVEMHAGERLVASVADHRVTLSPLVEPAAEPARRLAPPAVPSAVGDKVSPPAAAAPEQTVRDEEDGEEPSEKPPLRREASAALPTRRVIRRPELALASPTRAARPTSGKDSSISRALLSPLAPTPPAAAAPRPALQPPAVDSPASPTTTLGGGGVFCSRETAQYRFEQSVEDGISAASIYTLALANPERDASHSWCGEGSVRLRANFTEQGRRNYFGRFLRETGQMVIRLDRSTDFTGRTVTMHVFVEGPSDARFSAEVFVVHRGHWVGSEPMRELSPGRWWTIKHTFRSANPTGGAESSNPQPYPGEGLSPVTDCNRVSLAIRSTGARRNWTGAVYVDDVGWR
jgi:ferric-dicitrate binding protein FerR (iron transport regulator)